MCVCDVCVRAAAVPAVQRGRHSLLAGKEREEGKIRKEKKESPPPPPPFPRQRCLEGACEAPAPAVRLRRGRRQEATPHVAKWRPARGLGLGGGHGVTPGPEQKGLCLCCPFGLINTLMLPCRREADMPLHSQGGMCGVGVLVRLCQRALVLLPLLHEILRGSHE